MSKTPKPVEAKKHIRFAFKSYLVPLRLMRRPEFLQKEFKESRAEPMAANFDLDKLGHLVVNLRDGIFWIIDGCHRHYALIKNDFAEYDIPCDVYENLSDAEMAGVFLGLANRRVMGAYEKFNLRCDATESRESEIRRVVESNRGKISRDQEPGCVSAVAALGKVYDVAGAKVLGQVIRAARDAFGGDPTAFDGQIIRGLGLVFNRHNGRLDEQGLIQQLAQTQFGVRGLLRRAEAQREKTGNQKAQCIAAAIVDAYNKGARRTKRLPPWWKEAGA